MSETKRRRSLGRGLGALIPQAPARGAASTGQSIPLDSIRPNPFQPRSSFPPEAMRELADSIREKGVVQPILVRKVEDGYELVAGERRFRAATFLGLETIPAVVRELGDREALEIALIENLQREDLSALEEAQAYRRLADEFGLGQEEIATRVGKSRPSIANTLRLLQLPEAIRDELVAGRLSAGHARALVGVSPAARQIALARDVVRLGLSVRQLEERVRAVSDQVARAPRPIRGPDPDLAALERELERSLATRVRLKSRGKGGRIVIEYYSGAELERLLGILRRD